MDEQRRAPQVVKDALAVSEPGAPLAVSARTSPEERRALDEQLLDAHAPATWAAYKKGWRDFEAFCSTREATSLPATVETVRLYIKDRAELISGRTGRRLAIATIEQRLAAICKRHDLAELPSPTRNKKVFAQLEAVRNERGEKSVGKRAIDRDLLHRILATVKGNSRAALKKRALLFLDWHGAFRRSEVVSLKVRQLDFRPDHILITLGVTKTSRGEEEPEQAAIKAYPEVPGECPVTAVRRWMAAAGIAEQAEGYLFPGERGSTTHLHPDTLNDLIKKCLKACGIDPAKYGSHSARVGWATQMARDGHGMSAIQKGTRHKTPAMVSHYIREADPLRGNAADKAHGELKREERQALYEQLKREFDK